jgi:hypothetical protein
MLILVILSANMINLEATSYRGLDSMPKRIASRLWYVKKECDRCITFKTFTWRARFWTSPVPTNVRNALEEEAQIAQHKMDKTTHFFKFGTFYDVFSGILKYINALDENS